MTFPDPSASLDVPVPPATEEELAAAARLQSLRDKDPTTLTAREQRMVRGAGDPPVDLAELVTQIATTNGDAAADPEITTTEEEPEDLQGPLPEETLELLEQQAAAEDAALELAKKHLVMSVEEQHAHKILKDAANAKEARRELSLRLATQLLASWSVGKANEADEVNIKLAALTVRALERELAE